MCHVPTRAVFQLSQPCHGKGKRASVQLPALSCAACCPEAPGGLSVSVHMCVCRRDEEHHITALLLHIWAGTVSSSRGVTSTNLHVHAEETAQQENNFRT